METIKRDGDWCDQYGACKVCGGEIPYGHADHCDIYKMERQITELKDQLEKARNNRLSPA